MTERERLTKRDEFGNADIIGVSSPDLQLNLNFAEFNRVTNALNKLADYEDAEEAGTLVRLPCKVGDTVWVSPNNGKSFHTGKLYGMNENGSYLVFVDDKVRDFVDCPFMNKSIYDWFFKIYTREEAEKALKERGRE